MILAALFGAGMAIAAQSNRAFGNIFFPLLMAWGISMLLWTRLFKRGVAHINEGQFEAAIAKFTTALKWRHIFFISRIQSTTLPSYNIAVAYSRWGKFEDSLEWLSRIQPAKLPKVLQQSYYGLYAFNLMHGSQDLDHAETYIDQAKAIGTFPSYLLSYAYLSMLRQDWSAAGDWIQQYLDHPDRSRTSYQKDGIKLKIDTFYVSIVENYYLGLYHYHIGDRTKAREHLFVTAMSPYDHAFKQAATDLYNQLA